MLPSRFIFLAAVIATATISAISVQAAGDEIDYDQAVQEWLVTLEKEIADGSETEKENAELLRDWILQVDSALDDGNLELAHALLGLRTSGLFRHPLQAKVDFPLSRRLALMVEEELDDYVERIDRFHEKVSETVKSVESGANVDPLLLEGNRIERSMERLNKFGSHFRIDNRFRARLDSAINFARLFADYLDKRAAGDMIGANSALRSALNTPIGAETFTRQDAERLEVRSQLDVGRLFDDVRSVAEFEELSEEFEKWKATAPPVTSLEDDGLPEILEAGRRVKRLQEADDTRAALLLAGDVLPSNELRRFPALKQVFSTTVDELLKAQTKEISGVDSEEGETPVAHALRAMKQRIVDGEVQPAYLIGRTLLDSGYRDGVPAWLWDEVYSLENWVVGKRFSEVGDGPMAVKYLRRAMERSLGHFHSGDSISEELGRWKAADPELFEKWEETDDRSILRELEGLKHDVQGQKVQIEELRRSIQR